MHEILFKIGDFTVYSFAVLVVIGLLAAVFLFRLLCDKAKLDDKAYNFYLLTGVVSIGVGFLFAAIFQSIYYYIEYKKWTFGAITFMGGLVGGVACFILATLFLAKPPVKKQFWRVANLITPSILVAHAFGRIGCFLNGCCYGKTTTSWIGVTFPGMKEAVIPTQLIEAVFLFIMLAVVLVLLLKFKKEPLLLLIYLYSYAVFRFIIEFFRGDSRGQFIGLLSPSQWQSIFMLMVAVALTVYIYVYKKTPFAGKPIAENAPDTTIDYAAVNEIAAQHDEVTEQPKGETEEVPNDGNADNDKDIQ